MEATYSFEDVLTGAAISCSYPCLQRYGVQKSSSSVSCESVFFPGCSFLNYGLPLVQAVYDTLREAKSVQGMSLLCCGKILSYEPDGEALREHHKQQLCASLHTAGVKRLVVACPNCVAALREVCALSAATSGIEVVALPQELARLGYRIDANTAQHVAGEHATFCPHDSCPDRQTGEFACGMRTLAEALPLVEAKHNRKKSVCCGSLPRAAGNVEAANKCAQLCGTESVKAGASAILTPCVSCSFQLSMAQHKLPVFHYLELLYNWRIDWQHADAYMKLRFLFDDLVQKEGQNTNKRAFVALSGASALSGANNE